MCGREPHCKNVWHLLSTLFLLSHLPSFPPVPMLPSFLSVCSFVRLSVTLSSYLSLGLDAFSFGWLPGSLVFTYQVDCLFTRLAFSLPGWMSLYRLTVSLPGWLSLYQVECLFTRLTVPLPGWLSLWLIVSVACLVVWMTVSFTGCLSLFRCMSLCKINWLFI